MNQHWQLGTLIEPLLCGHTNQLYMRMYCIADPSDAQHYYQNLSLCLTLVLMLDDC